MSRRELIVITVPAGIMRPEEFGKFREYVIESILRDVLVLDSGMKMSIEEVPTPGEVKVIAQTEVKEEVPSPPTAKRGPGSAKEEKTQILEQLRAYRERHGLGSLKLVAEKANRKGVTGEILRMLLMGDAKLEIAEWRAVGKALAELKDGADVQNT